MKFLLRFTFLAALAPLRAADTLDCCVIDTEGGKAVIVVAPGGGSFTVADTRNCFSKTYEP